jgi:hypothetical protein
MKIYSPALITAKGKVTVGHGANLVWCDILGRREKQIGRQVEYFFPSWNHQGKSLDGISRQTLEDRLMDSEESLRKQLNLFGIDEYVEYKDSNLESRKNAQKHFLILKDRRFIKQEGDQYFLEIGKIANSTNFFKILEKIRFAQGDQIRRRLIDLLYTLNGLYPISKPRRFATRILEEIESSQKINPVFDLAVSPLLFSEEPVDYSIDGSRTLLHGTFIPIVIWAGLFDKPFSRNISVHGYALGDSEMDADKFYEKINAGILDSDIMRYCAIQCTDSFEDTNVNLDNIIGARKLLYRALNLSKHILKHYGLQEKESCEDERMKELVEDMHPSKAVSYFETEIFTASKEARNKGRIDKKDISRFLRNINGIRSIFPVTARRIEEIVYDGRL